MITKIGIYRDPRKTKQWVVRWFGEYAPATGKQKRYSKAFHRKRDAEAFQSESAMAFKEGQQRDKPEEVTLRDFCEDWLKTRQSELKPGSSKLYRDTIRRLYDSFGRDSLLSGLTPRSSAKFIAELKPLRGENLSNWTRHRVLRNCRIIFGYAVKWQLLSKNPFSNTDFPRLVMHRWHYVKPNEYQRLLAVAPSLYWKALYALAYTAGLRFGELLNLTWNDIDVERGEVRIENRAGNATMPPFHVKDYEARRIPLPKHTLDILTELYGETTEGVPYVLLDERRYKTVIAKWKRHQHQKQPWQNKDMVNNVLREY